MTFRIKSQYETINVGCIYKQYSTIQINYCAVDDLLNQIIACNINKLIYGTGSFGLYIYVYNTEGERICICIHICMCIYIYIFFCYVYIYIFSCRSYGDSTFPPLFSLQNLLLFGKGDIIWPSPGCECIYI